MFKHAFAISMLLHGTLAFAQTTTATVVRAADRFRDRFINLSASVKVTVTGFDVRDMNGKPSTSPVPGRIDWRQDGVSTFLSFHYQLSPTDSGTSADGYFLDHDIYVLPDQLVEHFTSSRQVLITHPCSIAMPGPGVALFGYASEPDNAMLAARKITAVTTDGTVVRLALAPSLDDTDCFEVAVDSSMDYAPVAWRRGALTCDIQWRRNSSGAIEPVDARICSDYGRSWTYEFERLDVGNCAPIRFRDQPGTLVTDYVMVPGKQTTYRVTDGGEREFVKPIDSASSSVSTPNYTSWTVGSVVLAVISAVASAFWWKHRSARAPKS